MDYNRHLEEVVCQVEELLFATVQNLVLQDISSADGILKMVPKVSELFKHWEYFKNVGDEGKISSDIFIVTYYWKQNFPIFFLIMKSNFIRIFKKRLLKIPITFTKNF